jgi:hypothetical protein
LLSSASHIGIHEQRASAASDQTQALLLVSLPAEAEGLLSLGAPERPLTAIQLALVGMAPAGARGYRVVIAHSRGPNIIAA